MIKRSLIPTNNVSQGVSFLLRGAKKRRAVALSNAKMINADMQISPRLVALQ